MKKGFTLIELLAVILILGIIALIAIPQIGNIVDEAKESAAIRSAEGYIKGVRMKITLSEMNGDNYSNGTYSVANLDIKLSGAGPDNGSCVIENSDVVSCNLNFGKYVINYNNGEYTVLDRPNGEKLPGFDNLNIIWHDLDNNNEPNLGDKICIDEECFYIFAYAEDIGVAALAEWNLNVGFSLSQNDSNELLDPVDGPEYNSEYDAYIFSEYTYNRLNPTVIKQDRTTNGYTLLPNGKSIANGIINLGYTSASYAEDVTVKNSGILVQDTNTAIVPILGTYKGYIENKLGTDIQITLMHLEDLRDCGCRLQNSTTLSCSSAPS